MSEIHPIFLSSCFEDPKGTRLRIRDRILKMTGADSKSKVPTRRPIWMAEDFSELRMNSPWSDFEKCEFCLEGVRRAECFVAVITNRYGTPITIDGVGTVTTSFFEAELFEAALLGKPSFIFLLDGYVPEGRLASLLKLLAPTLPNLELNSLSEDQILRKIDHLLKHYSRPRWLRRSLDPPKLKLMVDTLFMERHRSYDPRSSPPPLRFLGGNRLDQQIEKPDPKIVISVLERAVTAETHQVRLTLVWFAIRALMSAPFDDPACKEFLPLWIRAFSTWTSSGAWYGLHGHARMGCLAALGSLAEISFRSTDRNDPTNDVPHGSLASEYYSISKLAGRSSQLLDLALTHVELGIESHRGDPTNEIAIRASVLLRMKRRDAALQDYRRVAENRRERGGQAYGEALNEWGYALFDTGKKREGIVQMEAGLELLDACPPSGFRVRAMRKLAAGYARRGNFGAALELATKAHDLAIKIGAHDQIHFMERFVKKLHR